ncbi:coiled-coil domain-containing protein 73-like isoform X6 [Siniperca chuatsi]|uniref:coiled-coil domain-containing protein 73-like isoform X6 n=1 Tax=Siniperca chuatsi TaxID=119488 RepID=UPI001CE04AC0|nr:coiled-coil domain-containing protein 73-like isoform X6 [Siniperca chuatsi]
MDLSADSGTPPTHTTVGGPVLEHELSMSSAHCQTESGGTILLQLLEFKIHLLEAVEELHIRRDAETRFEDQISKLVLEKQELEWEKESLQHQSETVAHQHTESLINVKKQFQAKIRKIEEEKGKYQVSAELKDKEINNLKEKLKSLQLLKYNLEKKSSELEQKLALQSRSKDSHLNQLGEVEKRFSALTRQCAIVKQAHEKLEQNVDEAMNINKKLTLANGKQEATIVSLKKELEEVSKKLIMAKMSSVRHDKILSPTGREQCIQQLQQKLSMETEMNKKLGEENVAVRAEKQEVMRSLQHTQQLLLSQTQIVSRVELELQTQREQYQDLKQEHGVMRKKSKAMEDKVAQLMESFAASKTGWDQEKAMFLDRIKSELQDLQAVKDAYEELQQKHTELSSQAKVQAQHIYELEGSSMSEQSTSDPGGLLGHPPTTIPMFLKSKHNKVPLVITGASDLLNGSGVSGTAASSRRHQQGETCSETATADTESRASLSISSFPVSTSSITVSRLSWQTTPGCSRATTSAAGPSSESDWELFCSQEREDQQSSSFRTQISKIEQFLNTERLRLPKRRRTDN